MSDDKELPKATMETANVTIYRTDGTEETLELPRANLIQSIHEAIGADALDVVNLRDGRVMLVDDLGHPKALPVNREGTRLYHGVCIPGTTHKIRGDVAVAWDQDFAAF